MIKHILFVEDNPILLQMYAMVMESEGGQWAVSTAGDGLAALELMKDSPFDVVVSDLNMPGMGGIEFFHEVRKLHPRASRIILSGISDQEEVARCLNSTHQFLAKPLQPKELKATVARVGGLDAYLQDEQLQALVGRIENLPSFPSLYVEITKELAAEHPSVEHLTQIISKDPGLTAKMLQAVNSAVVGLSRKISNPFEAVQFLGLGTMRSLALSAHVFSSFENKNSKVFPVNELWDHGSRASRLARMIMQLERADKFEVEEADTAAMLHDIGKLMLAENLPDQFRQALDLAMERKIPLHQAELELLGATHAGVAAYLLGLWGLPAPVVEAVAFHHTPQRGDSRSFSPLTAVHVANVLDHALSVVDPYDWEEDLDLVYLKSIGVRHRLETWHDKATKAFSAPM